MTADTAILGSLDSALGSGPPSDEALTEVLDQVLAEFDCVTGTIHVLQPGTDLLQLRAQRGVPEAIMAAVRSIPIGKGMAGLAAERREPVQVCNLQTDDSGVAKPDAKLTKMEGSIAFPMLVEGELRGTMGVAKPIEYDFTPQETDLLLRIGALVGGRL